MQTRTCRIAGMGEHAAGGDVDGVGASFLQPFRNLHTFGQRVARLDTGMAWAEDAPSRSRHLITNIEVEPGDAANEVKAYSNFMVYRSRAETEQDFYVGARRDVLRRVAGTWKIAGRKITLDQNVLLAKNVSIFF